MHVDEVAVKGNLIYVYQPSGEGLLEQQVMVSIAPGTLLLSPNPFK